MVFCNFFEADDEGFLKRCLAQKWKTCSLALSLSLSSRYNSEGPQQSGEAQNVRRGRQNLAPKANRDLTRPNAHR